MSRGSAISTRAQPGAGLALFTKPARPGRVKTRLVGPLSAEQAAELHAALLHDMCERLQSGPYELVVAWALEETEEPPADLLPFPLPSLRQRGPDLGVRMYRALEELGRRHDVVAAIGSDLPDLSPEVVEAAFERLRAGTPVVLGPAEDGGYYLVGVRTDALDRRLFQGIDWSTSRVLEQTLERCRELGLRCELLASGHDVDTPADLERLALRLAASEVSSPRTRALLSSWGMA